MQLRHHSADGWQYGCVMSVLLEFHSLRTKSRRLMRSKVQALRIQSAWDNGNVFGFGKETFKYF